MPGSVRVLLLALAIIDDVGAIIVIAIFYSVSFAWAGVGLAALGIAGVLVLRSVGVRSALAYVVPGVVLWWGLLVAGIHPTIAGVILGLLTPARSWCGERGFLAVADAAITDFRDRTAKRFLLPRSLPPEVAATTAGAAERSTED